MIPEPQRMKALSRANEVRLARAELKRRIAVGEKSAAEVILECPWEASTWSVGELLRSQRRWGSSRCRKFLVRNQINEIKPLGTLTERQRKILAEQLRAFETVTAVTPVLGLERREPLAALAPELELAVA